MIFSKYILTSILLSSVWLNQAFINSLTVLQNPSTGQILYCLGDKHNDDGEIDGRVQHVLNFLRAYKQTFGQPMVFLSEMHPEYSGPDGLIKQLTDLLIIRQERSAWEHQCMLWTLPLTAQQEGTISLEPLDIRIDRVFNYSLLHEGVQDAIESPELKKEKEALGKILSQSNEKNSCFLTFADIEQQFNKACDANLIEQIVFASLTNLFHYFSGSEEEGIELAKNFAPQFKNLVWEHIKGQRILAAFDHLEISNYGGNFDGPFCSQRADSKVYCAAIVSALAYVIGMQLHSVKNEIYAKKIFYRQCAQGNANYAPVENMFNKIFAIIELATRNHRFMNYNVSQSIDSQLWNKNYVDALILHRILSSPHAHEPFLLYFGSAHIAGVVDTLVDLGWEKTYTAGYTEASEALPLEKLVKALNFEQLAAQVHNFNKEGLVEQPRQCSFVANDMAYQVCEYPDSTVVMYHGYPASLQQAIENYRD